MINIEFIKKIRENFKSKSDMIDCETLLGCAHMAWELIFFI